MYKGKHLKSNAPRKLSVLLVSLALLVTASVVGTVAFLATQSGSVTNTFTLETVPNKVVEENENAVKKNVQIQNIGDVPAYIRAMVIVTWAEVDTNGNPTGNVYGTTPVKGTDYTLTWGPDDENTTGQWIEGKDGFYYFTGVVPAKGMTDYLLTNCHELVTHTRPTGDYRLSVEIIAQSIQADGMGSNDKTPVEDAWGIEANGSVTAVDATTGALTIRQKGGASA